MFSAILLNTFVNLQTITMGQYDLQLEVLVAGDFITTTHI